MKTFMASMLFAAGLSAATTSQLLAQLEIIVNDTSTVVWVDSIPAGLPAQYREVHGYLVHVMAVAQESATLIAKKPKNTDQRRAKWMRVKRAWEAVIPPPLEPSLPHEVRRASLKVETDVARFRTMLPSGDSQLLLVTDQNILRAAAIGAKAQDNIAGLMSITRYK